MPGRRWRLHSGATAWQELPVARLPTYLWIVPAVLVLGCTSSLGRVGAICSSADAVGIQRLHPGVVERACRTWIFGIPIGAESAELETAVRTILDREREADILVDAQVTSQWLV